MVGIVNALIGCAVGKDNGAALPASISVIDSRLSPTNSTASFSMNNTGLYSSSGNGSAPSGTWRNSGASAEYDVRFDVSSGALTTGTPNTWENLASTRSWSCTDTTVNGASNFANGTLRIRRAATGIELDSCPLSISATKDI